jgi:ELWxxDGT repeat protein
MSSSRRLSWLIVSAGLLAFPAFAETGPARLVEDLAPGTLSAEMGASGFLPVGSRSVFISNDGEHRLALWITDGTAEGTSPLAVLCPPCDSAVPLGSTGSIAFYRVGYNDLAIWRTDGTPAGTFPVTSGLSVPPSDQRTLEALSGGRLFFNACSPELGCELWSTDGSAAGTAPAGEIVPGPEGGDIRELVSAGGRAFLIAGPREEPTALWLADAQGLTRLREVPGARSLNVRGNRAFFIVAEKEVWTSDGTAAGTRRVAAFPRQSEESPIGGLTLIDGRAYFVTGDFDGRELWSVGQRPGSQRRLASIPGPYAWIGYIEKSGNRIVFVASGSGGLAKLWSSRGNFKSTSQLTGCPGGCPHVIDHLTPVAPGRFVFYGKNQEGGGIWVTNGTPAGTRLLQKTGLYGLTQTVEAGGRVLIQITDEYETGEIWVTDGTAAGTFLASLGGPSFSHYWGWSAPLSAGSANGRLVFPGFRGSETREVVLWSSDGSRDGSHPILEARPGQGSHPSRLTPFQDGLLAWTCTGVDSKLQFVQGTRTTLLQTVAGPDCQAFFSPLTVLGNAGDTAVFLQHDGLWRTDGTPEGTQVLFPSSPDGHPFQLVRFGDEAAVSISTRSGNTYRVDIWLTDGTPEGTRKYLELPAETDTGGLTFAGGRFWFFDLVVLPNNEIVLRPWVSDGTPAGTYSLGEKYGLMPLPQYSIVEAGGRVYFLFALFGETGGPLTIWGSDGTPAGTGPVVTAESGAGAPETLTAIGDRLYFTAPRSDGTAASAGRLLPWVSDGTDGGTELLADVTVGEATFAPVDRSPFVELDGRVWFAAADKAHGDELWSTDGTPEGTARLIDIAPGLLGSHPRGLTVWNGALWFRARDGVHGMELWTSDGTAEGTRFVQDIARGAFWSTPQELTATEGGLYFAANDGEHGRELWVVPDF